jgi:hypothetical protein
MATTTPNYGWDVPTSTDYVKDGATAIETLGDDIDATLYTALGGAYPGLRLIKTQTVGTGVTTVLLSNVFSSTYDNYRVVIGGVDGSSIGLNIRCQLGSTPNEHYGSLLYDAYDGSDTNYTRSANAANFNVGLGGNGDDTSSSFDLHSPNLAKRTTMSGTYNGFKYSGWFGGAVNTTTQYTSFNILVTGGATLTGGTISVYGYGKS